MKQPWKLNGVWYEVFLETCIRRLVYGSQLWRSLAPGPHAPLLSVAEALLDGDALHQRARRGIEQGEDLCYELIGHSELFRNHMHMI